MPTDQTVQIVESPACATSDEAGTERRRLEDWARREPENPVPEVLLGHMAARRGEDGTRDAIAAFERALRRDPNHVHALAGLAGTLLDARQPERAAQFVSRALKLAPGHPAAMQCAGDLQFATGRLGEAGQTYDRILQGEPRAVAAWVGKARLLLRIGDPANGVRAARKAIELDPGFDAAWTAFGDAIQHVAFGAFDAGSGRLVCRLLELGRVEGAQLTGAVYSLLARSPAGIALIGAAIEPAGCSRRIEAMRQIGDSGWDLMLAAIRTTPIGSVEFEDGLVALRSDLLQRIAAEDPDIPPEDMVAAIARQAELGEYVWTIHSADAEACGRIRDRIQGAARLGAPPRAIDLLALATCNRLDRWDLPASPLAPDPGSPLGEILASQIALPMRLAERAAGFDCLTGVQDRVSGSVRTQYEENPYPRWSPASMRHVRRPPDRGGGRHVLIAGCGTGLQVVARHLKRPQDRILAVDLSRASLAYASWACESLGVTNVEFAQADILGLDRLDRQFDEIECVGVLHHLERPLDGWRVLLRCLAPNGRLLIGLYSKIARASILEARQTIASGWPSDIDGIRRLRAAIRELGPESPLQPVTRAVDFYNASMCRDLLLHTQETDYDLLEIRAALDQLGLDFLEFESLAPGVANAYRAAFPRDGLGRNLGNWHRFEVDHPETFLRMYNFWCAPRKKK